MDNPELATPARQEFSKKQILEVWALITFVALLAFAGGAYATHHWFDGPKIARLDHVVALGRRAEIEKDSLATGKITESEHALHTLERMQHDFKSVGITGPFAQTEADAVISRIAFAECTKVTGKACGPKKPEVVQASATPLPVRSTRTANVKKPLSPTPKGKRQMPLPKHLARANRH